jgi:hypothetical protein
MIDNFRAEFAQIGISVVKPLSHGRTSILAD